MTTREVAESSSPLTHLERESEVVSAPAEPAASLVFFPRPPWVPWDGVTVIFSLDTSNEFFRLPIATHKSQNF